MSKGEKAASIQARRGRDLAYRAQLGLDAGQPIPTQLGAGSPAGGTGAYRGRDRATPPTGGRRTTSWRGRYTPDVPVTAAQVRQHQCPRCLAKPGDPCRNQAGAAVSAGHADRRKLAQQAEYKRLRGHGTRVPGSSRGESSPPAGSDTDTAGIRPGVARRQPVPERVDPASGRRLVSAFEAVSREYGGQRASRVDNGAGPTLGRPTAAPLTTRAAKAAEQQARQVPDQAAMAVPCRRCGAVVGKPCRDPKGASSPIHPGRRVRALGQQ